MIKLYTYEVKVTIPKKIKCIATSDRRAIKQVCEVVVRYTTAKLIKSKEVKDREAYVKALKEITI